MIACLSADYGGWTVRVPAPHLKHTYMCVVCVGVQVCVCMCVYVCVCACVCGKGTYMCGVMWDNICRVTGKQRAKGALCTHMTPVHCTSPTEWMVHTCTCR